MLQASWVALVKLQHRSPYLLVLCARDMRAAMHRHERAGGPLRASSWLKMRVQSLLAFAALMLWLFFFRCRNERKASCKEVDLSAAASDASASTSPTRPSSPIECDIRRQVHVFAAWWSRCRA